MTRGGVDPRLVMLNVTALLLLCAHTATATPDLRHGRRAGSLTVYPDDARRTLFFYPPGELTIATREDGAPDIHLLHARYSGSIVTRDQGSVVVRSIFSARVVLNGPTPAQLADARTTLASEATGPVELRPLPIRRIESAIVYAPVGGTSTDATPAPAPSSAQPLPAGHFEPSDSDRATSNGYWAERVYTLRLAPEDAQLLSSALEHGQIAMSVGYAFLADAIAADQPLQQLSGPPALVAQLQQLIADGGSSREGQGGAVSPALQVVRAGALAVTADLVRWPSIVRRVDINDSAPPEYAALDIYCYDFSQGGESPLYEKQIEIEAAGVGGRPVVMNASFNRSQPDLFARSVRFPVAVRLDRPYRFRVIDIARDGTSNVTPWKEQASWTDLLDVTSQGDGR